MSVCGLLCIVFCVCEEVGSWGLGSLMMRIKGLLNCLGGELHETEQATKIRMQNARTGMVELSCNHSCRQTCTFLHKLWLYTFKGGEGVLPQTALLQVKAEKTKQEIYTVGRERGKRKTENVGLNCLEKKQGREGELEGIEELHTEEIQILEIMREV